MVKRSKSARSSQRRTRHETSTPKSFELAISRRNPVSDELVDAAEGYAQRLVRHQGGGGTWMEPAELVERLSERALQASKMSRAQHLERIALAYSIYLLASRYPSYHVILTDLAERSKQQIRKNTDPLRLIVESLIHYGEINNDCRRLYSRDVSAIHHLQSRAISPVDVLSLADNNGEGLDTWSRNWSEAKKKSCKSAEVEAALPPLKGEGRDVSETSKRPKSGEQVTLIFAGSNFGGTGTRQVQISMEIAEALIELIESAKSAGKSVGSKGLIRYPVD